jgi:hypothetical protein
MSPFDVVDGYHHRHRGLANYDPLTEPSKAAYG